MTLTLGENIALITLMLNVLALVWGAAKLSNKLDNLVKAFEKHVDKVENLEVKVNNIDVDVAVLYDGKERRSGTDRRK